MANSEQHSFARAIAQLAVAAVLIYALYRILYPFLFPVMVGGIICTLSRPYYEWVRRTIPLSPIAALITIFIVSLLVAAPLALISVVLIREIAGVSFTLAAGQSAVSTLTERVSLFLGYLGYGGHIDIGTYAQHFLSSVSSRGELVVGNILSSAGSAFIAVVTAFYLLQSQEQFHKTVTLFSPLSSSDTERIFDRTKEVISATVKGNLVLVGLQVLASTVGFFVFGISSPLLLGTLYGIASLVPAIGSSLVWVPVVLFQIAQGNYLAAAGIAVWSVSQVAILDNYVGPRLIQHRAHLHPYLILLGVLGGVSQFGMFGVVIGPTAIALGMVGLEIAARSWKSATPAALKA